MNPLYHANINLPYGQLGRVVNWCQDNCKSDWQFDVVEAADVQGGTYQFTFRSDMDAVKFILWQQ